MLRLGLISSVKPSCNAQLTSIATTSSIFHRYSTATHEEPQRKRKTEWKRRQGGESFLDHLIINVRGGDGGHGCVAFHREKSKSFGPPSGGNGGRGGDVYIMPTEHLTTLSSVPKRVRGESGGNGHGTWQNGKNGAPLVIKVPLGTVVKELAKDDPRRIKDEWEEEEEVLEGLSENERRVAMRRKRWLHYPGYGGDNEHRDSFKEAEAAMFRQERERRRTRRTRTSNSIHLDLDKVEDVSPSPDAPLATGHQEYLGHLIATGGMGGLGNPVFLSQLNRSPKFASRGCAGERVTLSLELKLLADVGLVGMPNAGKSTLLRALTGGRARTEVASYAFTTLNPVVGVIRVADDGTFEGSLNGELVHDETWIEKEQEREMTRSGAYAFSSPRNRAPSDSDSSDSLPATKVRSHTGHSFDLVETFRFTIADNPGLISRASENVGLGHSFLRSMERSLALVYVVDLSGPAPWDELVTLRRELETYKPGMSAKARMVIANKADLLCAESRSEEEEARQKLRRLEEFVATDMVVGGIEDGQVARTLDVVPTSAKFSQNLQKVVNLLRGYVGEARAIGQGRPCREENSGQP